MLVDCTAILRPPFATEIVVVKLGHGFCSRALEERGKISAEGKKEGVARQRE